METVGKDAALCEHLQKPEEGATSLGARLTGSYNPPHVDAENSGSLQEQQVLLTTESSSLLP